MGIGMPKPVTPGRVQSAFWTLPKSRSTSLEHTIKPGGESRKASARFNNKKSKGVITSSRKDEFTADQAYKTRHFLVLTFPHRLWRGERRLSPPEFGIGKNIWRHRSKSGTSRKVFTRSYNCIKCSTTTSLLNYNMYLYLPTRAELGSGTARTNVFFGIKPLFWRCSNSAWYAEAFV